MRSASSAMRWRCQPLATDHRSEISDAGVAMATRLCMAYSISSGLAFSAADRNWSPGTNITTKSSDPSTLAPYSFFARSSTCAFRAPACRFSESSRAVSSSACCASMYAAVDALASMTTARFSGSRTVRSGLICEPLPAVCSAKSQYACIPASSTTRRSCTSPQLPICLLSVNALDSLVASSAMLSLLCASRLICGLSFS